ncbi:MAG: dihydrofolate reductase family protein [Erysipelotrichaceae bacterium]
MTRKVILNAAISIDGFMARSDGSIDWIAGDHSEKKTKQQFHFDRFLETCDVILMGRKTYEQIDPDEFRAHRIYVYSSQTFEVPAHVTIIHEDVASHILALKKDKQAKSMYLFGGASLISSLLDAQLVDELIIGIIPCILGSGIAWKSQEQDTRFHLYNYYLNDGIMVLHYQK